MTVLRTRLQARGVTGITSRGWRLTAKATPVGAATPAPWFDVAPTISGNGKIGSPQTVSLGHATGADTLSAALYRVGDGVLLAASIAEGGTYTPQPADDQDAMRLVVTATGPGGSSQATASQPITYAAPAFSAAPSLGGVSFTIGQMVTLSLGAAAPAAALTIEEFSLDGVDKRGELVGLSWDSAGAAAGTLTLRVRATNSGGSVVSAPVTATLSAGAAAPAITTPGQIAPAAGQVGTVFTLTPPAASGIPAPAVTLTALTQAGVDVLAQVTGGQFTSTAEGALVATWTADNGVNPPATAQASATITAVGAVQTVSAFGGQITFDVNGAWGQYADGSYWTTGSVVDMSPALATVTRTVAGGASYPNMEVNGWQINPGNAEGDWGQSLPTLADRQRVNFGYSGGSKGQAYDQLVIGTNLAYDASLRSALPIPAGSGSVVKFRMKPTPPADGRPTVDYGAVITLVSTPPPAGSIRPPLAVADKTPVLNVATLNLGQLPNLSSTGLGLPTFAVMIDLLQGTYTHQNIKGTTCRNIVAPNGTGSSVYSGTYGEHWTQALLGLCYDAWTPAEKQQIAIRMAVFALDIAGRAYEGAVWNIDTRMWCWTTVAAVAELFDSQYLRDAAVLVAQGQNYTVDPTPVGESVFGDIRQMTFLTQGEIDASLAISNPAYHFDQAMLGWPVWRFETGKVGNTLGYVTTLPASSQGSYDKASVYQHIGVKSIIPACLLAHFLPAMKALLGPYRAAVLAYADRYMGWWLRGDYVYPAGRNDRPPTSNSVPAWVSAAWARDRGAVELWVPPGSGVTNPLSLTNPPYDGYVYDGRGHGPNRATTPVSIPVSGLASTGQEVQYRLTSPGYTTPWSSVTVGITGGWSGYVSLAPAHWGHWYTIEARIGTDDGTRIAAPNTVGAGTVVMILGQSELEYLIQRSSFYRQLAVNPALLAENITVQGDTQGDNSPANAWDIRRVTTASAATENPAIVALANMLHTNLPPQKWLIVDSAVPGTGRSGLMNDADVDRYWTQFTPQVDLARSGGSEIAWVIENWMANDAPLFPQYEQNFAPFYFGQRWGGGAFTLGTDNPDGSGLHVDHCLWDAEAADDTAGRGVFAKADTKYVTMGLMPWQNAAASPAEETNYSSHASQARVDRPFRALMRSFVADPRVAAFSAPWGPASAHVCKFGDQWDGGTGSTNIHPSVKSPYGQVLLAQHIAASILKAEGVALSEPQIAGMVAGGVSGGTATHVDVYISLPNGGQLTTIRRIEGGPAPSPQPPHWQPVMGFEIGRLGDADSARQPVWSDPARPAAYRGTVTIQDPGTAGYAIVRITPVQPFVEGDWIDFGRGSGSCILQINRDGSAEVYKDLPLENVPALSDPAETYPYPGLPVRQAVSALTVDFAATPPSGGSGGGGTWSLSGGTGTFTVNDAAAAPAFALAGGTATFTVNGA